MSEQKYIDCGMNATFEQRYYICKSCQNEAIDCQCVNWNPILGE